MTTVNHLKVVPEAVEEQGPREQRRPRPPVRFVAAEVGYRVVLATICVGWAVYAGIVASVFWPILAEGPTPAALIGSGLTLLLFLVIGVGLVRKLREPVVIVREQPVEFHHHHYVDTEGRR